VASKGGIEAVVSAMTSHRDVVTVQEQGCYALGWMSLLSANQASDVFLFVGTLQCLVHSVMVSIIEGFVSVCSYFIKSRNHHIVCLSLFIVCLWENLIQASIAAKGGIEAVLAAMSTHPGSAAVQERACATLASIAMLSENQASMRYFWSFDCNLVFTRSPLQFISTS
jgi:hypothetical protein